MPARMTITTAAPRVSHTRLRLIEFLRISEHRIYAVLITQSNMVYHKLIEVPEDLPQDFINSVSRYLNEQFARKPLEEVRRQRISRVLEFCAGNRVRAAQILGIGRTSLYRYFKREARLKAKQQKQD